MEDLIIARFVVLSTGTHCSLACKDCGNFIPYIPKENRIAYPYQDIDGDIQKIFRYIKLKYIQIQGGEALLHPHLKEIIKSAYIHGKSKGKVDEIVLATNGKVPKLDLDLLKLLKEYDVKVRISDYSGAGIVMRDSIEEKLQAEKIRYSVYRFVSKTSEWFDMGGIDISLDLDDNLVRSRFEQCGFNECYTLENGIMGRCSRSVIAQYMQNIETAEDDYIKIREIDGSRLRQKLADYFNNKRFMAVCRACNGTNGQKIPAAIQMGSTSNREPIGKSS